MNIMTKQELEDGMFYRTRKLSRNQVKEAIEFLEINDLIIFREEPKTFKVFLKKVTIDGKDKSLYYVTDFHLTEKRREAKLFDQNEEKEGYAYELVNKLI